MEESLWHYLIIYFSLRQMRLQLEIVHDCSSSIPHTSSQNLPPIYFADKNLSISLFHLKSCCACKHTIYCDRSMNVVRKHQINVYKLSYTHHEFTALTGMEKPRCNYYREVNCTCTVHNDSCKTSRRPQFIHTFNVTSCYANLIKKKRQTLSDLRAFASFSKVTENDTNTTHCQ